VLIPLLVLGLAPYAILLLGALSGISLNPSDHSRGELDRLAAVKHQGMLLNRSRRVRESAAKTGRYISSTTRSQQAEPAFLTQEPVLDRLLQRKRFWSPGSFGEPPAIEEHITR
jgi:hypothetical protein